MIRDAICCGVCDAGYGCCISLMLVVISMTSNENSPMLHRLRGTSLILDRILAIRDLGLAVLKISQRMFCDCGLGLNGLVDSRSYMCDLGESEEDLCDSNDSG